MSGNPVSIIGELFSSHNSPVKQLILLFLLYRLENCGLEGLN